LHAEVHDTIVEVFATKVSIACRRLDLENTILNREKDTSKVPPPIS